VNNTGATAVNASCNWWGSFSGPTSDQTAGPVVTSPFLISSNLDGTCAKELQGVAEIGAGDNHTCARMNDGTARCWGANGSGQLGDGTTTNRRLPVVVKNPAGTGRSRGSRGCRAVTYTCARIDNGTARCWGANTAGMLGTAPPPTVCCLWRSRARPTSLHERHPDIGPRFAHVRDRHGTARCWGANTAGMLGDGTTTNRLLPVVVKNPAGTGSLTSVSQVEAGGAHPCGIERRHRPLLG
jgi:hypothetical protein